MKVASDKQASRQIAGENVGAGKAIAFRHLRLSKETCLSELDVIAIGAMTSVQTWCGMALPFAPALHNHQRPRMILSVWIW
jgi:hypothetical protein